MSMRNTMGEVMQGAEVFDANDEKVGKVVEVGRNSFKVEKGFIFHKDMHLPMSAVARTHDNHVHLNVAKDRVMTMGAEQLPAEGHAWYGTDAMSTNRTTERGKTGRAGETESVPIIEEELKAGVREKQGGMARVTKSVVEEQQSIDVPVQHEEVYVTERAVNRAATPEEMKMMDRDIEIPLKQQEVVTQKQAVVTGEVNIRKETVRDTERVTDTVRREEVNVEDAGSDRVHVEGERGARGQADTGGGETVTEKRQYDAHGNLVSDTERVDKRR
ncbi:MAG: DUF2382 domain-containing protein [Chloroflexota bacterium]|nr:DUF2382 domain-containing protein [Chloroflexota bacterium]